MRNDLLSGQYLQNHILVKFKEDKHSHIIKENAIDTFSLKKLNLKKKFHHSGAELLELHEEDDFHNVIRYLHEHTGVHYAQPDYKLTACGSSDIDKFSLQWGLENNGQEVYNGKSGCCGIDIDTTDAWKITRGSDSVIVAVIDTGIDIYHIDLKDNIYKNTSEIHGNGKDDDVNNYCDDISGWDFLNKDNTVYDSIQSSKHGTEVAGIIAAKGVNSGTIGVAPGVKLLPLKIMEDKEGCTSAATDAIDYAKAKGIRIANCSWGGTDANDALKHHMQESNMLFICAAGNQGYDVSLTPFYPACFDLPNVISVAAINNKGDLWPCSNYGNKIHVAAPGAYIWSTIPSEDQCSYGIDMGTSLAAPYVTGIAALILSKFPELDAVGLKDRIIKSVRPLDGLKGKVITSGLVNAYKALTL
jgi:subtilisin family serine protease